MTASTESEILDLVIGTAGHIDHGKTSLVKMMTGVDADRLKEEQERGMTIDLGFAPLLLEDGRKVGVVDVPGHERFIKNMVAGATGIDLVLLVVAADDGVMPQTVEHLDIMTLLGIERGLVALTKIDLVDEEMVEIASETIREFLQDTFLESAPIFPLSSQTRVGFEPFWNELQSLLGACPSREHGGLFRMPIQRVFSATGQGTVVTGIPVSGEIVPGDEVEVLPLEVRGKVRKTQSYMEETDRARSGRSCAINVSDVNYKTVHRGMVAATPGYFHGGHLVEARLSVLDSYDRGIKHLSTIRFHSGTAESIGRVAVLEGSRIEGGGTALVQIRLEDPVVVAPGDRYVLRLHSPMVTIGGGRILGVSTRRLKRNRGWTLELLRRKEEALGNPDARVEILIESTGNEGVRLTDLRRQAMLLPRELDEVLEQGVVAGKFFRTRQGSSYLHQRVLEDLQQQILSVLSTYHRENPYIFYMGKLEIKNLLRTPPAALDLALHRLLETGKTAEEGDRVRLATHEVALSIEEQELLARLEGVYLEDRFCTPRKDKLPDRLGGAVPGMGKMFGILVEQGILVEIEDHILFHRDVIEEAKKMVVEEIEKHGELISAQFRDRLGTTRKYVIPLLDYFDRIGLTIREGSRRVLRQYGRGKELS